MTPDQARALLTVSDEFRRVVASFADAAARIAESYYRTIGPGHPEARLNRAVRLRQEANARRLGQVVCGERAHGHLRRAACPACGAVV